MSCRQGRRIPYGKVWLLPYINSGVDIHYKLQVLRLCLAFTMADCERSSFGRRKVTLRQVDRYYIWALWYVLPRPTCAHNYFHRTLLILIQIFGICVFHAFVNRIQQTLLPFISILQTSPYLSFNPSSATGCRSSPILIRSLSYTP